MARVYNPGEDIIIPRYVIHWLINDNDSPLEFTCEYAPHPWDENDEPEFRDVTTLLNFVNKEGLKQQVLNARIPY